MYCLWTRWIFDYRRRYDTVEDRKIKTAFDGTLSVQSIEEGLAYCRHLDHLLSQVQTRSYSFTVLPRDWNPLSDRIYDKDY